jgi:hypothetical protein
MKKTDKQLPRGYRNNNPLNIRRGTKWIGMAKRQNDKEFCVFESMAYGYRAAFRILQTYYFKYKLRTVVSIINRWAPPSENNSMAYAKYVAEYAGVSTSTQLPSPKEYEAVFVWVKIMLGMTKYENGLLRPETTAECFKGYRLANMK